MRGVLLRLYRRALRLLPRGLRRTHGEQMATLLADQLRDARSPAGRLRIFVGAVADALAVALAFRWERRGRGNGRFAVAARSLLRRRGFLVGTVGTLAVALGMLTAVWTALDYTSLRPLPYPEDHRLASANGPLVTPEMVRVWEREAPGIAAATPWTLDAAVVRGAGDPRNVRTMTVDAGFLELLGVRPVMGRLLTREDIASGRRVAVVSESLWESQFGEGSPLGGQTLSFDSQPFEVVGVIPRDFRFGRYRGIEAWLPIADSVPRASALLLLDPGRSPDDLLPELTRFSLDRVDRVDPALAAQVEDGDPGNPPLRMYALREMLQGSSRPQLVGMALAGLLVLVVAAANVSSLFLARTEERREEFAIRRALGAESGDVVRDVLAEAALVAVLGGGLGLLCAPWILNALLASAPGLLHGLHEIRIDGRIAVFAAAATVLAVLIVGVFPALAALRGGSVVSRERAGTAGRGTLRFLDGLAFVEIALTMLLVVGAGLLVRTWVVLFPAEPGFAAEGKLTMEFQLPEDRYPTAEAALPFVDGLERATASLPGAPGGEIATSIPFDGLWWMVPVDALDGARPADGRPGNIHFRAVTPGYLELMEFDLLEGRTLTEEDEGSALRRAVVNQRAARAFWPDAPTPLGRTVTFDTGAGPVEWEIVGVVADVRTEGTGTTARPSIFMPLASAPQRRFLWVVDASTGVTAADLRSVVRGIDAGVPPGEVQTFEERIGTAMTLPRFQLTLLGTLAAVGALLAGLGCFSVLSYRLRRGRRELGIRLALGARPGRVGSRLALRMLTLGGGAACLGAAGAWALSSWIEATLFLRGVSVRDPATYGAGLLFVLLIVLAAAAGPAVRAMRVDPAHTLRGDG